MATLKKQVYAAPKAAKQAPSPTFKADYAKMAIEPQVRPSISAEIDTLNGNLACLRNNLAELGLVLQPVLASGDKFDEDAAASPYAQESLVGQNLEAINRDVAGLIEVVLSLTRRVTL